MTDLTDFRQAKDGFFGHDPGSPLTPGQQKDFRGLTYFDERPEFAFEIRPEPHEQAELVQMQTSTGETAQYERWAQIRFSVGEEEVGLTVYRDPHHGSLFLPFRDATSGQSSYGAGRYLDLPELPDGRILVDFNYAYNPYCAYNDAWTCPIPPPENHLRVAIEAGERAFAASPV